MDRPEGDPEKSGDGCIRPGFGIAADEAGRDPGLPRR
jgi:hypothetical protein